VQTGENDLEPTIRPVHKPFQCRQLWEALFAIRLQERVRLVKQQSDTTALVSRQPLCDPFHEPFGRNRGLTENLRLMQGRRNDMPDVRCRPDVADTFREQVKPADDHPLSGSVNSDTQIY
jgi:hypothetical protein